jgi:glucokinase
MKSIGIDVGGTKIKGALFRDSLLVKSVKNPANGEVSREAVIAAIKKTIDSLLEEGVSRIGIVSAGDIDEKNGVCLLSFNLKGWTGCPIKETFENIYHLPVYVDNDAIGALWGEMSLLKEKKNVTMLTFGTGVGGASVIDGVLSRDKKTAWGHYVIVPDGLSCLCGKKGCAEMYLSANALLKAAQAKIPSLQNTLQLNNLYLKGDPVARAIMENYADLLEIFLKDIDREIHPSLFVLGGGLMNAPMMRELIRLPKERYCFAQLGNQAGVVGAASLPIDR